LAAFAANVVPLAQQERHVGDQLVLGGGLGRGTHDETVLVGLDPVEDATQALAHVVGQSLRDAVGLGVRNQHHEPSGQRHLLGKPCPLVGDRVLGDLAGDQLLVLEDVLDAGVLAALFDVLGVVLHIAAIQHGVLGVAMSTKAASMPGRTFWMRPT
jgi:hypothetical protein